MGDELQDLLGVLARPLSVLLVVAAVALLYWLGPAGETEFKWVTPGAAAFAVGWLLASFGLRYTSRTSAPTTAPRWRPGFRHHPAHLAVLVELLLLVERRSILSFSRSRKGRRGTSSQPKETQAQGPSLRETSSQLAFASFSGKDGTGGVVCAFNDECWKGRRVCRPFSCVWRG